MRTLARVLVTAALTAGLGAAVVPAADAATDPAVTGCPFTPLYATYQNGQLSNLKFYVPGTERLTVSEGDGNAWFVTVDDTGSTGWMPGECVLFLA